MELLLGIFTIVLLLAAVAWAWRLLRLALRRPAQADPPTLASALEEEPDTSLTEQAQTFRRPHVLQTVVYVIASGAILLSFVATFISDGWTLVSLLLAAAEVLLLFTHGTPLLVRAVQSLSISQEGIRVRGLVHQRAVYWWEVRRVLVADDLSRFRIETSGSPLTYDTGAFAAETRLAIFRSLRAHLSSHYEGIQPWPQGSPSVRFVKTNALSIALFVSAMIATAFIGREILPEGGVLGLRCSYASGYLREKYSLPDRHGCVILRVNPGTGAYEAGLRAGDMIVGLEGVPVTSGTQFTLLFESQEKTELDFAIIRSGETGTSEVKVRLGGPGRGPNRDDSAYFFYLRARGNDNRERAIADYTKAIDLEPEFDLAYAYRGALLVEGGSYEQGLADLNRALELDPELTDANMERSWYYIMTGDLDAAISDAERAIELLGCAGSFETYNYDCHINHVMLAYGYGERGGPGDPDQAVDAAKKAIGFYPERPRSYYLVAFYLAAQDEIEEAQRYAAEYLEAAKGFDEPDALLEWARRMARGEGFPAAEGSEEGAEPSRLFVDESPDDDITPDGQPVVSGARFSDKRTLEPPPGVNYLTPERQQLWVYFEFDNAAYAESITWEWTQQSYVHLAGGEVWPGVNKGSAWLLVENRFVGEESQNRLVVRFDQLVVIDTRFELRAGPYIGPVTFHSDPAAVQRLVFYTGEPATVYMAFEAVAVGPGNGIAWLAEKDGAVVGQEMVEWAGPGRVVVPVAVPESAGTGLLRFRIMVDGEILRNAALAIAPEEVAESPPFGSFAVGLLADIGGRLEETTKDIAASQPEFNYVIQPLTLLPGSELSIRWTLNGVPISPFPDTVTSDTVRWVGLVPGVDDYLRPGEYEVLVSLDGVPVYADVVVVR